MAKPFLPALILTFASITAISQDTIPHIEGRISISIKRGTIECDLILSNIPWLTDYYLRLNSGMNIRYIKNAEGPGESMSYDKSLQDTLSSGETSAYFIPAYNKSGKYLPRAIHFNYVGMYPVITDTSSAEDWRGNIAFTGTTLRADGIQSGWCPILYDVKTDTRYEKVTYNLDITCNDCQVIYMNGSPPVTGTHAIVKSAASQDLTLFAGDFRVVPINGTYFLNPDANDQQLGQLENSLHSYQEYLEKNLGIPYKGKEVYIQTTPVSKHNSWAFASYPTIVNVSWKGGLKAIEDKKESLTLLQYMAHELSHYYFGTVRAFNSELGNMLSEGFAEYLSLNITRTLISDSFYLKKLQSKVRAMRNFKPKPIADVHSQSDYENRELFSYYYAPLLFLAVEKEIGQEKMWEWIKALLQSSTVFTNYSFVEQTLRKTVEDETKFSSLRDKYFNSTNALQNAISTLAIPSDQSVTSNKENDTAVRTYYYFFFSRPIVDIGSSQNRVIKHTEVGKMTCTWAELSKMATPIFEKLHNECENEAGCTGDFNTYDSMQLAETQLKRWLERWNKDGKLLVKILKP